MYRLLKEQDLIASPAYILMEASDKFQQPTTRVNEMWQTDFTYFKIIGWGWYYLSTVLDDYSRYIIAWRLCTGMSSRDVSDTLDDALRFTGLDTVKVNHKPRLLSDNGPCYISGELADYLEENGMTHTPRSTLSSTNTRQDRALASFNEESDITSPLLYPVSTMWTN